MELLSFCRRTLLFLLLIGFFSSTVACSGLMTRREISEREANFPADRSEALQSTETSENSDKIAETPKGSFDQVPAAIEVQDLPPIPVSPPEVALEVQEKRNEEIPLESAQPDIPVEMNDKVEKWIRYFTEKDKERFQRFLDRGRHYRDVVENVLQENDLPPQLYYLAMIESGYRTSARSKAKAVGVWQFIAGTATRYGLRVDKYVDERQDPIRSTEAAAKYLRDLYNVFGSWHLAMAAYNAGEIRILRAVFKGRTRDFWELIDAKVLPSETAEYVPKFLAVVQIGEDPEKYGFRVDDPIESYPELEAVPVRGSMKLQQVADQSGISVQVLQKVNPQLTRGKVPANGYEIWVPKDLAGKIDRSVGAPSVTVQKEDSKAKPQRSVANQSLIKNSHLVRSGETLQKIASKYKMSVGHLMRINGLKSSKIRIGERLRTQAKSYSASNVIRYRVRRGDSLSEIAQKFGTSVGQIKRANKLFGNKVISGQTLKIRTADQNGGS